MTDEVKCRIKVKKKILNNILRGHVEIISKVPLVIQQAFIEIAGIATCGWKLESLVCRFPKFYPENTTVKGFQEFYYTRQLLCGGEISHHHWNYEVYTFMCYWPSRLPGSWSGDYGKIEYRAKVTVQLEENKDVYTHIQLMLVKFRRHLSSEMHLLYEARVDVHRTFSTMKSLGNVNVSVWIPICGIAAGQRLPVLCSVQNYSKLHFGSIVFVLTRIDIYRSDRPITLQKRVRTDVCKVARVVKIHKGRYDYFSVLETSEDMIPTSQFYTLSCCQTIYEVWVTVQGAFKRYNAFGYPNIDTPGIPVIIGTKPIKQYNCFEITSEIFKKMYELQVPVFEDELPEDFRQIITTTEEELSKEAVDNLERQLQSNEQQISNVKQSSLLGVHSKELVVPY